MKKKNKTYRHSFVFDEQTDSLLKSLSRTTDTQMTLIVQRGIEMFAEKKGIKNENVFSYTFICASGWRME